MIVRPIQPAATADIRIAKLLYLIGDNVAGDWRVGTAARLLGLSTSHLDRLFKENTGVTIKVHVQRTRVRTAQDIIQKSPSQSLKQVAAAAGFVSINHFSRVFSTVCGQTPGVFRRSI